MEHRALNKNLFLQKPISTDDLIAEINNKINSKIDDLSSNRGINETPIVKNVRMLFPPFGDLSHTSILYSTPLKYQTKNISLS